MNNTDSSAIEDVEANTESEAATQELLAIPGLVERIKQQQTTPKADPNPALSPMET